MKKFRKVLAFSLALVMGLCLVACDGKKGKLEETTEVAADEDAIATQGDVPLAMPAEDSTPIYIYSWDEELGKRLQYVKDVYPQYADLIRFKNLNLSGKQDEYKSAIKTALANGGEKVPSIVACEDDLAKYFLNQNAFVPVSEVGIIGDMYADAYSYTVEYATVDGNLKGMTWQATPGCFVYRTDIAEEVLGTSKPEEIQEYVKDWDSFFNTAEQMKENGYKMLSGSDDAKAPIVNQKTLPWVENDAVNFDDAYIEYLEIGKKLYDGEYTNNTQTWTDDWYSDMHGDVFGWFGSTWFLDAPIGERTKGTTAEGMFQVCQGPAAYHWGGTYLGVTDQCTNKELAALVLYTLCCDETVMYKMAEDTQEFMNNKIVMENVTADGKGGRASLGGEDPIPVFMENADKIDVRNATAYDSEFDGYLDQVSQAYNTGEIVSVEDAIEIIKKSIRSAHPDFVVQ